MRAVYITLFFAILSSSLAIRTTVQQKTFDIKGFKIDSDSKLGSALAGLMEITQLAETAEVIEIISNVKIELTDLLRDTEINYNNEKASFEESKSGYESTIREFNSAISQNSAALQEATVSKDRLEALVDASAKAIEDAQAAIVAENERRDQIRIANAQKVADLSEAIAACEEALKLLQEIKEKDLTETGLSLIQTASNKIKTHISKISKQLAKINLKGSIAPMVKMLVEIAQEGVNAELIEKIAELIRQLRDSLVQERDDTQGADAADESYHTNTIATLNGQIEIETQSLNNNSAALDIIYTAIDGLTKTLESLNAGLTNATNSYNALISEWASKEANYNDVMERLRRDIQVLAQCLEYLNSQSY